MCTLNMEVYIAIIENIWGICITIKIVKILLECVHINNSK